MIEPALHHITDLFVEDKRAVEQDTEILDRVMRISRQWIKSVFQSSHRIEEAKEQNFGFAAIDTDCCIYLE